MVGCRNFILVAALLAIAGTTAAQTVRIPLPELLGPQSIDRLDVHYGLFLGGRSADVLRSALPPYFNSVGFEWSGIIKAGRVVGDGIEREPIEQVLRGNFSTGLSVPGYGYGFLPTIDIPSFGPFEASWRLHGPIGGFIDRNCIDCTYPPDAWTLGLQLVPDYFALGNSIPFLRPAGEFELREANQGLILLEPIEVNVTSAALVFDIVPEPGTVNLSLSGLGMVIAVRMRLRRSK